MNCCGAPMTPEESDEVGRMMAVKLSAFVATLRESAFAVGLEEAQDAARLMAHGLAGTPAQLRSAFKHLFSARREEWERFDGLFDAFWLKKRVRQRSAVSGNAGPQANPALKSLSDAMAASAGQTATDQVPSADETGTDAGGTGRMEGASDVETLGRTDFRG